ncbi:MAG: site-specific integrase [Ruminococcus sp.]|nr:site-specific integrase [Ruminococcus sp.]
MAKRGENIYKRKDGRWEGRFKITVMPGERRKYRSVYGKTYREVKEKINIARQAQRHESITHYPNMSEAVRLWMQAEKNNWKDSTLAVYHQITDKYIIPCLGNIKIDSFNHEIMENFVRQIAGNAEEKSLSRNYLSQICLVVRRIIVYMNRRYDNCFPIPCNPVTREHSRQIILPGENTLAILERYLYDNRENDTCLGILLALHTGIRIGELSALKWGDINIEEGVLSITHNMLRVKGTVHDPAYDQNMTHIIEQSPKTSDSARIIPIPPCLLPLLHTYQKKDSCYIISGLKKPWAEPRTIQYRFKSILQKCHLEYFNFHMLRHSFASRCVAMGLDIKSLSEILGHSNIRITLNLYVHPSMQQKKELMKRYDVLSRQHFSAIL